MSCKIFSSFQTSIKILCINKTAEEMKQIDASNINTEGQANPLKSAFIRLHCKQCCFLILMYSYAYDLTFSLDCWKQLTALFCNVLSSPQLKHNRFIRTGIWGSYKASHKSQKRKKTKVCAVYTVVAVENALTKKKVTAFKINHMCIKPY